MISPEKLLTMLLTGFIFAVILIVLLLANCAAKGGF